MPWTGADYDAVEAAIRAVRDGTRKNSLSGENGGMQFVNTPLPDLIKLREAILAEVTSTAAAGSIRRPRIYLMRNRRGL